MNESGVCSSSQKLVHRLILIPAYLYMCVLVGEGAMCEGDRLPIVSIQQVLMQ